jgi:regulator of PEP synthase PpsR (kinase-PPPase family)
MITDRMPNVEMPVQPKQEIKQESSIFDSQAIKPPTTLKEALSNPIEDLPTEPKKKRGMKKGVVTEQQLENLRKGREKSIETRKMLSEQRQTQKELEKKQKDALYYGMNVPQPEKLPVNSQKPLEFDYDKLADMVALKMKPTQTIQQPVQPVQVHQPVIQQQQQQPQQPNLEYLKMIEKKIRDDERNKMKKEQEELQKKNVQNHAYFSRLPAMDMTDTNYWSNLFNVRK